MIIDNCRGILTVNQEELFLRKGFTYIRMYSGCTTMHKSDCIHHITFQHCVLAQNQYSER